MIQDIFAHIYYRLTGESKWMKPVRFIVRTIANILLKIAFLFGGCRYKCTGNEDDVIVSLTSFPPRIKNIWITIETLLRQSVPPQRILLWLSKEQFEYDGLPKNLKRLQSRGVEIRFVDGDIRSHKKYLYVFREYPDSLVLLADDDIIYPSDLIETLLDARKECNSDKVVVHKYGSRIRWSENGELRPYNQWDSIFYAYSGNDLFFGSGGGTLLRPNDLFNDVINIDLALKLCPSADDIWLNAMAKLSGCTYVKINNGVLLSVQYKDDRPLYASNVWQNENDVQLTQIINYYKTNFNINPFAHE